MLVASALVVSALVVVFRPAPTAALFIVRLSLGRSGSSRLGDLRVVLCRGAVQGGRANLVDAAMAVARFRVDAGGSRTVDAGGSACCLRMCGSGESRDDECRRGNADDG